MVYSVEELEGLEQDILKEFPGKITEILTKANRTGKIEELLKTIGLENLLEHEDIVESFKGGKIVIIGESDVPEKLLIGVAKQLGIDKSRFEFCLDYGRARSFNCKKMQYKPQYRVVLFGPVQHSTISKGIHSSMITEIESNEGYPKVVRLNSNERLKITKSNFKQALEKLIAEDYI